MVQMFQHATMKRAVFFFLLLFFLPLGKCPLTAASQPDENETSFVYTTFSGSASMWNTSSAVSKEGCLRGKSTAECCCCLRSQVVSGCLKQAINTTAKCCCCLRLSHVVSNKRPIQLRRLHAELRLRLPVPSSTCRFSIAPSFPPALNAYSGHQLARTKSTL